MRGRPVDDNTRKEIERRARAGESRNAIARALGISGWTVTKYAPAVFDRAATAAATRAAKFDAAEARRESLEALHELAKQEAQRARSPYVVHQFTPRGQFVSHTLPLPPSETVQKMAMTVGLDVDKLTKELERSVNPALEAATSLATQLAEGFAAFASKTETPPDESNEDATAD